MVGLSFQNTSVLENHHWRSAVGCLLESNLADQLKDCRKEMEEQIASLILATDITRQQEFLTKFKVVNGSRFTAVIFLTFLLKHFLWTICVHSRNILTKNHWI